MKTIYQKAWEIYCAETAGSMDVRDHPEDLPAHVMHRFMEKQATPLPKLAPHNLRRTIFGVVESMDDLFEGYAYSYDRENYQGGRNPVRPEGYYFFNSEDPRIDVWIRGPKHQFLGSLGAKPKYEIATELRKHCTESRFQSFTLIPWHHAECALILATDCRFIASPWLGFIDIAKVPTINPDNTEVK